MAQPRWASDHMGRALSLERYRAFRSETITVFSKRSPKAYLPGRFFLRAAKTRQSWLFLGVALRPRTKSSYECSAVSGTATCPNGPDGGSPQNMCGGTFRVKTVPPLMTEPSPTLTPGGIRQCGPINTSRSITTSLYPFSDCFGPQCRCVIIDDLRPTVDLSPIEMASG